MRCGGTDTGLRLSEEGMWEAKKVYNVWGFLLNGAVFISKNLYLHWMLLSRP